MKNMKPRKPDKRHIEPDREYYLRSNMVDIPPTAMTPEYSAPQNMKYEEYIESEEWSTQIEFTPEEFPSKGRHDYEMKHHYPKDKPITSRPGREKKQSYAQEEPDNSRRDHVKQRCTHEEPCNTRRGYEMQQCYRQAESVRSRRANEINQNKNIQENNFKSPQPVLECYMDNTYYDSPVAVELVTKDINESAPIKKLEFNLPDKKPQGPEPDHMDWNDYHRLDVIHKFMDDLEYDFPSLCTTGIIGKSIEGRNLKILKISNSNVSNLSVWVDAGIHAREWIAPAVNTYIADHIVRNFDQLPENIRNKDWYFLPVINPDGYEYSHTVDRMWRKNRAWHGGHCLGVDLNRNFSLGWGGKGSSDQPTNAFYRGPRPFSEPESSAIRDMFLNSGIKFKVYITLHSYGQVIVFPYACSSQLAPDYVRLLEGATVMSKAIFDTNGNTYKVGISRDVMYGAAGTSNDFSHGIAGIPYCYLIELRSKKHKFRLPKEEIEETGNEILHCVIALMEFVDNYKAKTIHLVSENHADSENESDIKKTSSNIKRRDSIEKKYSSYKNRSFSCVQRTDSRLKGDYYLAKIDSYMNKNDPFANPSNFFMKQTDSCKDTNCFMSTDVINPVKVAPPVPKTQVWEVQFSRDGQRHFVKALDTLGAINIWKEERSTMDIMVEGPRAGQVAGMLHEREIPYSVAIPDVNTLLETEQGPALSKRKLSTEFQRTMDWKSFHRLDTIYAFMDNLAAEYPYLCTVSVIGQSVEGRDLKMLKISNGNESNTGVWLDGAIHPREWISPAVVTYIADRIVRSFNEQSDSVTNKDWYILPVMNPDGYEYTHTHDRMWRKNRARYGECVGVDLNRNFSYGFGEKGEEGSSDDPGNIFYRGPKAFSEPETAAVRRFITNAPTTFKVFLSFHSYGEVIIFPWGYTSEACPDYVELLEGGTVMAKAIHSTNGHIYKVGSTKDLMYYAAGTSVDWSYGVPNIPYSYMVELRGKAHRFLLPKEEIISTAAEVLNGVIRLMDFVDRRCTGTQSCACPK